MILNGKDIKVDYRAAQEIQNKIDLTPELPETAKAELLKKEKKELQNNDIFNYFGNGFQDSFDCTNNTFSLNGVNTSNVNRSEYYDTFQEMSECNFIHRGLQVIADDGCQKNIEGNVVKVYSSDEEIKNILEDLFNKRLSLNKELWSIIYETCKLGDNFYEIIPDSYEHPTQIVRIRYLNPKRVNRIEKNGKLAFYTYYQGDVQRNNTTPNYFGSDDKKEQQEIFYQLEPWQIIHFKISDKDFYPYGGSLLKSGVKAFRRLMMLEDGMVIYRLARVPERRVFRIDVGNLSTTEANRAIAKIRDNYRSAQVMDDNGNINKVAAALALTQDIFVPIREGQSGTSIETLQAGTGLQNIDDIKYFRDEILWTLNIPSEYLGFSDGSQSGKGSLAMQDVKFARFVERIQYYIEEGLTKIAAIELFFKKKKKAELNNFRLELTPPSNVKEIMDVEYLNQKMSLISSMASTNMFPTEYILKYVMRLSKKEISDIKFYKSLENQQNTGNGMDMGMGGGMDMGLGSAPMTTDMTGMDMSTQAQMPTDMAATPAMSVNTENMVSVFGKDVLIENKEDFIKLIKLAEEFERQRRLDNKENEVMILKEIQEVLGSGQEIMTNDITSNLYYENELGGLNYGKSSFKIFDKNNKLLEEEIVL